MVDHAAIAGAVAGGCETLTIQPLDMVKTRFQLNKGANPSMFTAFRELVAEGGVLRLYRGLLPEISGNIPTRTAMFAGRDFASRQLIGPDGQKTVLTELAAGFFAGGPEACATTPFQVVKVRLQNKQNNALYKNTLDCFFQIAKTEGPMAFVTGLPTTAMRNAVWNSAFFSSMIAMKDLTGPMESGLATHIQSFAVGLLGGVFATCCNTPFDVVKSRIQGETGKTRRYTGLFQTLTLVLRTEGPKALYKGFIPNASRLGLGAAVQIVMYEAVMSFFQR